MDETKAQANKRRIQELERIALGEIEVNKVEVEDEVDKKINNMTQESLIKKCPYCAEEVKKEALKCKHCGEQFDNNKMGYDYKAEKVGNTAFSFLWTVIKFIFWIFILYWVFQFFLLWFLLS